MYYNKQGKEISIEEAFHLTFEEQYRGIRFTNLSGFDISTVWIGIDMSHGFSSNYGPLIFETMVFPQGTYNDVLCKRYSTEEEAKKGHIDLTYLTFFKFCNKDTNE